MCDTALRYDERHCADTAKKVPVGFNRHVMKSKWSLCSASLLLLCGCSDPLSSVCEGRVNLAYQQAYHGSYATAYKAGTKAALDCVYARTENTKDAAEICRGKLSGGK